MDSGTAWRVRASISRVVGEAYGRTYGRTSDRSGGRGVVEAEGQLARSRGGLAHTVRGMEGVVVW